MSQGLGNMDRYRIPTIGITTHDPGRWEYGRPWIQALNSGDATGAAYLSTALPLLRPTTTPARMTAAARRTLERQYATIEITDSVAMMGGHQVALSRGYHGRLQTAVQRSPGRRPERAAALPRDDGDPRQGRGRRAARASPGHGRRTSCCRMRSSSCWREASGSETPRRPRINMQLMTWRDGAGGERRRSSPERATRCARGVSRSEVFAKGGHHAPRPARSCSVRRSVGRELARRSASTTLRSRRGTP